MPEKKTTEPTTDATTVAPEAATPPAKRSKSSSPATPPRNPVLKVKPRYVRLRNMLSQTLFASVVNDAGSVEEIKLLPREYSGLLREDLLTEHTEILAAKGHIQIG